MFKKVITTVLMTSVLAAGIAQLGFANTATTGDCWEQCDAQWDTCILGGHFSLATCNGGLAMCYNRCGGEQP